MLTNFELFFGFHIYFMFLWWPVESISKEAEKPQFLSFLEE
jgi:hypothetical protein